MTRRSAIGALAVGVVTALSGCGPLANARANYRYRMSVDGSARGSAVYEVLAERIRVRVLADETAGGSRLRGEAMEVSTSRGPIFLLMESVDRGRDLLFDVTFALAPGIPPGGNENFMNAVKQLGGWGRNSIAELPVDRWPLAVRFKDLHDPASATAIDPREFGVERIVVETTRDAITTGISKQLAWLSNGGHTLDPHSGPTFNPTFPQTVYQRSFSSEIEQ